MLDLELELFRALQRPDIGVRSRNVLAFRTVLVGVVAVSVAVGVVEPLGGGESISILGGFCLATTSVSVSLGVSWLSASTRLMDGTSVGDCNAEIVVDAMLDAR